MKFKALSEEEFRRYILWDDVLRYSYSWYRWNDFKDRDKNNEMSDWEYYRKVIIPAHTKLGRYLYGYEDKESNSTSSS